MSQSKMALGGQAYYIADNAIQSGKVNGMIEQPLQTGRQRLSTS